MRSSALLFICTAVFAADRPVSFNRDIRPIMSDTCFRCHGPDVSSRMLDMRLDLREQATKPNKRGNIPIVPGKPDESWVVKRIFEPNVAKRMPPPHAHKTLTDAQKETIRRWIAEGAKYENHWAYQPVQRPSVPPVPGRFIRNAIDAFIVERLTREGLKPSPEADRRTLLRRVTLDLTGLPPTPAELDAFLRDKSADTYEKAVDRLLATPAFAERQAQHWLDAVRYADSAGYHGDNPIPVWPYRDYVLRAFRDNMPFDRFTREQIAGDLLPNATRDQLIASAFNRLGRMSAEGGIQEKEYLAKYGADRVRTVSAVWLGATLGCAECHDHKFDPIATKDFYAMKAFFADVQEPGLFKDRGPEAWGARLRLSSDEQKAKLAAMQDDIDAARAGLTAKAVTLFRERRAWEKETLAAHTAGELAWRYQRPVSATAGAATLTVYNDEEADLNFYVGGNLNSERRRGDGLVVASGANPDRETYTVVLRPGAGRWTALGLEVWQDESLPAVRLSRGADRFVVSEVEAELNGSRLPFVLASSTGFGEPDEHHPMHAIDGDPATGWSVGFGEGRNVYLALRFAAPVETAADATITVRLRQESRYRRATVGRFRLALSAARHTAPDSGEPGPKKRLRAGEAAILATDAERGLPPPVLSALTTPEARRNAEQREAILRHFIWSRPEFEAELTRVARLEAERNRFEASIPEVLVTEAGPPRETRVLPRGNWMDDSGELLEPAVPHFLAKLDLGGRRATRLDLANWLVAKDNPLTPRVVANRVWRQFFGIGLSKVLDDLGSQGELPVHPELLDWLAAEFRENWDYRNLLRTVVLSHTYRQSSRSSPALDERDPDNRLLARQSRFRVDAETVRDIGLAVSGLLAERFGGPSVRPYQPEGYLFALNFPKRDYSADHGADLYRRGLYTHWQRTFLQPTLAAFDAPGREECAVTRVNSNTPLQALVLLNDPVFVEAARVFAQNMQASGGIEWGFRRALSRDPSKAESRILRDLYTRNLARFSADPQSAEALLRDSGEAPLPAGSRAPELAAMTTVARAILNLHETITRN